MNERQVKNLDKSAGSKVLRRVWTNARLGVFALTSGSSGARWRIVLSADGLVSCRDRTAIHSYSLDD